MSRLEKALNRAKQARQEGKIGPIPDHQEAETVSQAGKDKIINPVYTHTKVCQTDPSQLEKRGVITTDFHPAIVEEYNLLRAKLEAIMVKNGFKSMLIASPGPEEGKTLTAVNLAISLSRETSRTVLLVDADMRNPAINEYLGISKGPGLFEHLTKGIPLKDLLINPGLPRLTVLPAGTPSDYPADLLASPAMKRLVADIKDRYPERTIIFDSPPLTAFSDGLYLARYADAVLMVVRSGVTKENDLLHALENLSDRPLLGTVLNRVKKNQCAAYSYGKY